MLSTFHECDAPDDIQCVAGWDTLSEATFAERVISGQFHKGNHRVDLCTNPLTWRSPRRSEEGRRRVSGARDKGVYKGGVDVVLAAGKAPTWSEFLSEEPLGKEMVGVVGLVSSWPTAESSEQPSRDMEFWTQATNHGLLVPHISRERLGPTRCVQKWLRGWYHCADYALFWKTCGRMLPPELTLWLMRRKEMDPGQTSRL